MKQIPVILPSDNNIVSVADVFGRKQQVEIIVAKYCGLVFAKYNKFFRMARKPEEIHEKVIPNLVFATPDRCNEIYKMLHNTLNVYSEYLPKGMGR